ncbi:unnamed protein product [Rangifer tarandus platyrhynchus]|uniref:Uncharacterized protein n=1 Tax=Rangifer tarandus platyrhynchus TaxID=3082113 RepID=A0ABN8YCL1_RANTA|nr:unnamed protein product [Rangifer tarandus platyrhynchus]
MYSFVAFVRAVPIISMFRIRKDPEATSSCTLYSRQLTDPDGAWPSLLRGSGALRCEGCAPRPPPPCLRELRRERCRDVHRVTLPAAGGRALRQLLARPPAVAAAEWPNCCAEGRTLISSLLPSQQLVSDALLVTVHLPLNLDSAQG